MGKEIEKIYELRNNLVYPRTLDNIFYNLKLIKEFMYKDFINKFIQEGFSDFYVREKFSSFFKLMIDYEEGFPYLKYKDQKKDQKIKFYELIGKNRYRPKFEIEIYNLEKKITNYSILILEKIRFDIKSINKACFKIFNKIKKDKRRHVFELNKEATNTFIFSLAYAMKEDNFNKVFDYAMKEKILIK